ncbi:MAG TPA: hypothetical protein VI232_01495, partial [Reyranella sp.]
IYVYGGSRLVDRALQNPFEAVYAWAIDHGQEIERAQQIMTSGKHIGRFVDPRLRLSGGGPVAASRANTSHARIAGLRRRRRILRWRRFVFVPDCPT